MSKRGRESLEALRHGAGQCMNEKKMERKKK